MTQVHDELAAAAAAVDDTPVQVLTRRLAAAGLGGVAFAFVMASGVFSIAAAWGMHRHARHSTASATAAAPDPSPRP